MRATPAPAQDFQARLVFVGLLTASVLILGAAFAFQLIGGLQPCELCLWQRYPYAVAIGLTGIGIGLARAGISRRALAWLLLLCAVLLAPAHAKHLRGLDPQLAERYAAGGDSFTCLDGSKKMPFSRVNDDFCDCADGSDGAIGTCTSSGIAS